MPIYYNGEKIKNLYHGGRKIKEAYYNGRKVFSLSGGLPATRPPLWSSQTKYRAGDIVCRPAANGAYDVFRALVDAPWPTMLPKDSPQWEYLGTTFY